MKEDAMRSLLLSLLLAAAGAAADEPIKPVPPAQEDPARAALGRRLFNDTRLSGNGRISCATCHQLARGGADARPRAAGIDGRPLPRNTPTVLNAALNFRQGWDGSAATLEHQVSRSVAAPQEMGADWPAVVRRVAADPAYRQGFASQFRDGVSAGNIELALASYLRTLLTPGSRFDRYLRGDRQALSDDELEGYQRFKRNGCVSCHQGANVGGNMYQQFGAVPELLSAAERRRDGIGQRFKVPGLRNVARTAPYLHDGSAATLEDAIEQMFLFQLGRVASAEDRVLIARFLRTLDAEPGSRP
jgi:cytochrome c peroxidase